MLLIPKRDDIAPLLNFAKVIVKICNDEGIKPIAYGSLAYFIYTKDKNARIHDFDVLVSGSGLKKIAAAIAKKRIRHRYYPQYGTIHIFRNGLRVEVDSYEYWKTNLSGSKTIKFGGLRLGIVSLRNLKKIYAWAAKHTKDKSKAPKYQKRLNVLERIK